MSRNIITWTTVLLKRGEVFKMKFNVAKEPKSDTIDDLFEIVNILGTLMMIILETPGTLLCQLEMGMSSLFRK